MTRTKTLLSTRVNVRTAMVEQYDAKIQVHRETIRQLLEQRNADCSDTTGLPAEILCMIFYELSEEPYTISRSKRAPKMSWIVVTQVCRAWRRLALNEPQLWCNLIGVPKKWLGESFKRSKAVPLRVKYTQGNEDELLAALLLSPERFGALEFDKCSAPFLHDNFNKPVPRLLSLTVNNNVRIRQDLFSGVAPCLQSLTLNSASAPFGAPWLANIRELHLQENWGISTIGESTDLPSVKQFLGILGTLPLLECLSAYFRGAPSDALAPEDSIIPLPQLRSIDFALSISSEVFCDIFEHISTPNLRHLQVDWSSKSAQAMAKPMKKVCDFFVALTNNFPPIYEELWTAQLGETSRLLLGPNGPSLTTRSALPMHHMKEHIRILRQLSSGRPSLQGSDTVEEVHFVKEPSSLLILIEQKPSDGPDPPYPSLRTLRLESINFRPKSMYLPALKAWLKARERVGKLEALVLEGCENLNLKDVQGLAKCVKTLSWDGVSYNSTNPSEAEDA